MCWCTPSIRTIFCGKINCSQGFVEITPSEKDCLDWEEDGPLGNDEAHAVAIPHDNELLNKALGLEEITLRVTNDVYSNIEYLATVYGVSKQVLIKKAIEKMILGYPSNYLDFGYEMHCCGGDKE